MKSISLGKPIVIMMVGLPGAGKSFFARQFSETFGAPIVSFNKIHYTVVGSPTYSQKEFEVVQRLMGNQVEELMKTNKTFIVDGGLSSKAERQALQQFAQLNEYQTLIVWVQTDPATAQYRAMKRNSQKIDDKFSHSLDAETLRKLASRVTPPTIKEPYVAISGKHTYTTQARMVLRKIAAPREAAARMQPPAAVQKIRTPNVSPDVTTRPPLKRNVPII